VTAARRAAQAASVSLDRLEIQVADGSAIPFSDRSYDIAHASLVLHHQSPDDAVGLLSEMGRVARLGVVVNDLDRGWPGWLGAWLFGHLLTGNRYTRHDAPLSVRRAYRVDEAADFIRAAGLIPVATVRSILGQRYAIAAVPGWDVGSDPELEDARGVGE
jgi:SAM-dependent methyltransferase